MFKITEGNLETFEFENQDYMINWPMIYILEDGCMAYIGQSNNVLTRMNQHKANSEKSKLHRAHFIYSSRFNQSEKCKINQEYEFFVVDKFKRFNDLLYEKEKEYSLARMAAGYAWEWKSKKDKSAFDIEIEGIKKRWNHRTEGWVLSDPAINEVGCIHSVQGYDLNYAFIIMGKEIGYDPHKKEIIIHPQEYYDQNGKKTATYEDLLKYIKDIYYVLLTRGIKGTYLYICDEELKKYISSYVDVIY